MHRSPTIPRRVWLLWCCMFLAVALAIASTLLLLSPTAATTLPPRTPSLACSPAAPCLALVIDDIGRDLAALGELLSLEADFTFAVLPHAVFSRQSLAAIQRQGREVLLHLPMAPVSSEHITDEKLVIGGDGPLRPALQACLDQVPGAVGVNNHMGSAASRDLRVVEEILRWAKEHRLWFLDSRTTDETIICRIAGPLGVPCVARDVFLDDPPISEAIRVRWRQATDRARKRGWAVAIAHPHPDTIRSLRHLLVSEELKIVRLSLLLSRVDAT